MWDKDIFPEKALTELSNTNKGDTDYKKLLKLGDSNKRASCEDNRNAKKHKGPYLGQPQSTIIHTPPTPTVPVHSEGTLQPVQAEKRGGRESSSSSLVQGKQRLGT